MYALMIYSLKTGACLAVFYLFFKLLMSRDTFHRLNRLLLLGIVALSFVLPLCVITVYRELPFVPQAGAVALPDAVDLPPAETAFPWMTVGGTLFLAGVAVTLALTVRSLLGVFRIIRGGRRERLADGTTVVYVTSPTVPFSWGRYVVLSEEDRETCGREIVIHELAHVRLHHSLDLLVIDLAGCLQWFNPAIWLLRRELRAIHEYEADRAVLDSGVDARQYQLLLIRKAAGERWYSVANNLNHSKLKNRIAMMLCEKSSRWTGAKALLVVPLAGFALGAFAETAYVFPTEKKKPVTISVSGSVVSVQGVTGKPLIVVNGRIADSLPAPTGGYRTMKFVRDSSVQAVYGEQARDGVLFVEDRMSESQGGMTLADSMAAAVQFIVPGASCPVRTMDPKSGSPGLHLRTSGLLKPDPLFIVDGKELPYGTLSTLSPDRIESISVLKDKSALTLYGEKGRNGVIVITTKDAAALKVAKTGIEAGFKALDAAQGVMNSEEWKEAKGQLDNAAIQLEEATKGISPALETTSKPASQPAVATPQELRTGITTGLGTSKVEHEGDVSIYKGRITLTDYPEKMLVFLNGNPASKAEVEKLAPKIIKRMEVFKGETAVAKFGEKGRHGVIEITTRK